jgi:hypothetical protein
MRWRGPLLLWGGGIGIAVSLFLSDVPLFQKDVLRKIPAVSRAKGHPSHLQRAWLTYAFSLSSTLCCTDARYIRSLLIPPMPQVSSYFQGKP